MQLANCTVSLTNSPQPMKGMALAANLATDLVWAIANFLPVPGPPTIVGILRENFFLLNTLSEAIPAKDVPLDEPGVVKRFEPGIGCPEATSPAPINELSPKAWAAHFETQPPTDNPEGSFKLTGSPSAYAYRLESPPANPMGSFAVHLPVSAS